jgi:hypothetical protein
VSSLRLRANATRVVNCQGLQAFTFARLQIRLRQLSLRQDNGQARVKQVGDNFAQQNFVLSVGSQFLQPLLKGFLSVKHSQFIRKFFCLQGEVGVA